MPERKECESVGCKKDATWLITSPINHLYQCEDCVPGWAKGEPSQAWKKARAAGIPHVMKAQRIETKTA